MKMRTWCLLFVVVSLVRGEGLQSQSAGSESGDDASPSNSLGSGRDRASDPFSSFFGGGLGSTQTQTQRDSSSNQLQQMQQQMQEVSTNPFQRFQKQFEQMQKQQDKSSNPLQLPSQLQSEGTSNLFHSPSMEPFQQQLKKFQDTSNNPFSQGFWPSQKDIEKKLQGIQWPQHLRPPSMEQLQEQFKQFKWPSQEDITKQFRELKWPSPLKNFKIPDDWRKKLNLPDGFLEVTEDNLPSCSVSVVQAFLNGAGLKQLKNHVIVMIIDRMLSMPNDFLVALGVCDKTKSN